MNFQTTRRTPVIVPIDGVNYNVPRFLLAGLDALAAAREKKSVDGAMEEIGEDADARARFRMYFAPAPIDVMELIAEARTPNGVRFVLDHCLGLAGVEEEKRLALLDNSDPAELLVLVDVLRSSSRTLAAMSAASGDPGERGDPLAGPPPTSGGSPTTTPTTSPDSAAPLPASTPTP